MLKETAEAMQSAQGKCEPESTLLVATCSMATSIKNPARTACRAESVSFNFPSKLIWSRASTISGVLLLTIGSSSSTIALPQSKRGVYRVTRLRG